MFIACNLLQISPLKLCFEKPRSFLKCVLRMQEMLFQRLQFKKFPGSMPPDILADSCLRYSAHTFGDRILPRGEGKERMGPWQFSPTTEESLKNALHHQEINDHSFEINFQNAFNFRSIYCFVLDLTRSNYEKCNYRPSGRNRTCGPTIPVQRSNQLSYRGQLSSSID